MSKERWFREFERTLAEREVDFNDDAAYEKASEDAYDALRDAEADRADILRDQTKEGL